MTGGGSPAQPGLKATLRPWVLGGGAAPYRPVCEDMRGAWVPLLQPLAGL